MIENVPKRGSSSDSEDCQMHRLAHAMPHERLWVLQSDN
jgi:hypothetical protein